MISSMIKSILLLFLTDKCFDTFFVEFDFLNGECLKSTISKGLGFAIVLGSILVKLPQILKIHGAKSTEGISFSGILLEMTATLASVSYNYVNRYPFSSYGDSVFLLIQNAIIGALIFHYSGNTSRAIGFLLFMASTTVVLCSGSVPFALLQMFQASNIPIVLAGKLIQAFANYQNGSTGQLSAISLTMIFLGSLARIFTSIQETGDSVIIFTFVSSSVANTILMGQLLYYWNVKDKSQAKKEQ